MRNYGSADAHRPMPGSNDSRPGGPSVVFFARIVAPGYPTARYVISVAARRDRIGAQRRVDCVADFVHGERIDS